MYTTAVHNVERRKARAHIRGFLKEYGRNLLKAASNASLEIQAAKFVQELAGRIADEISWSITGISGLSQPSETEPAKRNLEAWLSSLGGDVEREPGAGADEIFDVDSDEELDSGLQFPNIDKVKDFLLKSEAFEALVVAMRSWLKADGEHGPKDVEESKG